MKVAMVFSGKIRELNRTKDYWLKFKNKYNADVFGSFWNETDTENGNTIDNFISIYNPVKYELESYDLVKDTMINQLLNDIKIPYDVINENEIKIIENGNILYMTYKIWRGNMLTKLVDEKYDIVVRIRTDVTLDDLLYLEKNEYFNLPAGRIIIKYYGIQDNWGFLDVLSYSKPEIMDYYSSFIFYFMSYIKDGFFVYSHEYLLRIHLNQKDIIVNEFFNYVYIHMGYYIKNINYYLVNKNPTLTHFLGEKLDNNKDIEQLNCFKQNNKVFNN